MRFVLFTLASLFIFQTVYSQGGTISGKVMSADIQIPLAKASVFLSNATFGTSTADDGTFTMANVKPGQYDLVVSYVGYDSFHQTILVGSTPIKLDIEMHLKSIGLGQVNITVHKFSKENYAMFLKSFLGESANAKKCKILNPTAIDLYYNKLDKVLKGHSDDFIIIENRALGYRIKYLLNEFNEDDVNQIVGVGGNFVFEDLKSSKQQMAKWQKLRDDAYYGSAMHFYRSLITNSLDSAGFKIYHLIRRPNPDRPAQIVIVKKMDHFYQEGNRDSLTYWQKVYQMRKYIETLLRDPLTVNDVAFRTNQEGIYGIAFPDNLYVVYTKKHDETAENDFYRPINMESYLASIITLYKKAAFFDRNGIVLGGNTLYEGAWANNKIAELLPVDYTPVGKPLTK